MVIQGSWMPAAYRDNEYSAAITVHSEEAWKLIEYLCSEKGQLRQAELGIKAIFNITIPLLSPTIFFVVATRVIGALQVFDLIYMVMNDANSALGKTQSLVYLFYKYSFIEKNMVYGAAIVILLLVITKK